ncbi:flagellar protein [Geomonas silvestris]|uniref:Flagellar protein n=1 Tax=Geomonas silvestris TaxID=2740184 RepID=A0A6V8MF07_9BACT|nr:flagellar biosynthetic protein FliO [Geomonas silvestris]GFO58577.1 flagellar protein [Geomonas silvestris]
MRKLGALTGALLLVPAGAFASDGADLAGSFARMLGSLVLVIGIILILYYLAGRYLKLPQGGGTPFSYIRVVETRHLAPKKSLMLVEVGGEYLLLSNTGEGINLIKQVEMLEEIEIVDERGCATLIPTSLVNKLRKITASTGMADLCLQKKSGGFA